LSTDFFGIFICKTGKNDAEYPIEKLFYLHGVRILALYSAEEAQKGGEAD